MCPWIDLDIGDAKEHVGGALRPGPCCQQGPNLRLVRVQKDEIQRRHYARAPANAVWTRATMV